MNTPTHLLSGMVLAQGVLAAVEARRGGRRLALHHRALLALAIFPAGAFLHLALDAMPHWFWVGHVGGAAGVPHEWFFRAAAAGALTLIPFALYARRNPVLSAWGALGGMAPDLEKAAYFMGYWPHQHVVFHAHSTRVSNHTGGLPLWMLVAIELLLLAALLVLLRALSRHRAAAVDAAPGTA